MAKKKETTTARTTARSTPAPAGTRGLKVRVKTWRIGYYGDKRRRQGDVFTLKAPQDFSTRWMEWVDPATPERITTGAEHLKQQHDEILGARMEGTAVPMTVGRDDVPDDLPEGEANPLGAE